MRPIQAADVMTPDVISVTETASVAEAARFLVDNEITGAAVRDSDDKIVGVVSLVDIADHAGEGWSIEGASEERESGFFLGHWRDGLDAQDLVGLHLEDASLTVADVMSPKLISVEEDIPVSEVATLMIQRHIHRLLVTRKGEVTGIITTTDLLGLLVQEQG